MLCTAWTPMSMERENSAAGIICSRLRASIQPAMLFRMVLGRHWLKEIASLHAPKDMLDLMEWAEDVELELAEVEGGAH